MISLPYPTPLNGETAVDVKIIYDYLYQLKEALEFSIDNIGQDNLSEALIFQISNLQAMIVAAADEARDAQSMAQQSGITVQDVVESKLFKAALDALQAAVNAYTDAAEARANTYADEAKKAANDYTDEALVTANNYTDTAKADAEDYADSKAQEAKEHAEDYSDTNLAAAKAYADRIKPTKVSELTNDTGFITNLVSDLVNYYTKANVYTKDETNNLISTLEKYDRVVVSELPATGASKTVYLVPSSNPTTGNIYTEWIYINGAWEMIGSQSSGISLDNYYDKTETEGKISEALDEALDYTDQQVGTLEETVTALDGKIDRVAYVLTVNYQTGNLEYTRQS